MSTWGSPRISFNQVKTVSDDPFSSILTVERGSGYTQYGGFSVPITMGGYPISTEAYKRYAETPWPDQSEETIVVTRTPPDEKQIMNERLSLFGNDDLEAVDDETPRRRRRRKQTSSTDE
jgi:hypothetical protein